MMAELQSWLNRRKEECPHESAFTTTRLLNRRAALDACIHLRFGFASGPATQHFKYRLALVRGCEAVIGAIEHGGSE